MNDEELQVSPVDGLAQLTFAVQSTLERRASAHKISLIQTRLLGILRDREPTMQELARLLELDKSSVTGLVDRAQRRGLVQRAPSTDDRRAVRVTLTEDGRTLVTTVAAVFSDDMTAMLGHLTAPEQLILSGLINKLLVAEATRRGIDLSTSPPPTRRGRMPE